MDKKWLVSIVFLGMMISLSAHKPDDKNQVITGAEGWIPNLGQIHNQRFEPNSDVTHLWTSGRGMNVQLRRDGLSYDTYSRLGSTLLFHRLDMKFVDASPEASAQEEEAIGTKLNFYGPAKSSGVSADQYRRVVLNEVYPGIDLVCSITSEEHSGVKYDFVVKPGADVDQVRMEYEGFDAVEVTDDEIRFELSGRTLTESIPESWIAPGKRKATVQYRIIEKSDNKLVVGLEWLNPTVLATGESLVIDPVPVLHWGTYYGDTLPDAGTALTTDTIGRVYIAGHTQSVLNIATDGAHQQTYSGGSADAFLTMFTAHGERLWSTYFGGTGEDRATGVAVDGLFDIYLVGNTNTVNDSLATDSAYQEVNAGGTDVFAAKFDNFGALKWSTFLGGAGNDTATACVVDTSGHVFISGYTDTGNWLESPEYTHAGGLDAFVVKLDTEGMPVWSTYYGGLEDDYGRAIAVDSLDFVFLTGSTFSEEGIATDSTYQDVYGGEEDAFTVCFNPDGSRKWGTYFGGPEKDLAQGVAVFYDAVYVTGYTWSAEGMADSLSFQPDYVGEEEAFLVRLNEFGKRDWSTYFGDSLLEKSNAVTIDYEGFVYIAGITNSENHLLSTDDVHQDWLRGEQEGFVAKFDSIGNRVWSTYYGGFQNDDIMGINVFGVTAIYITGFTWSSEFVAYYGNDIEYGGNTDAFLARLDMERCTPGSGICSGGGGSSGPGGTDVINEFVICYGDSLQFSVVGGALNANAHWVWYQEGCGGDGIFEALGETVWLSPEVTTTYYVRAESGSFYTTCNDITLIVVNEPVAEISVNDTLFCAGDSLQLSTSSGEYYTYSWSGPNSFFSDEQNPIIDSLTTAHTGWYSLQITNAPNCQDSDSVWVEVQGYPEFYVDFEHPQCAGASDGSIQITLPDSAGVQIDWQDLEASGDSISGLSEGFYSVVIHADGQCSALTTIELIAPPSPIDTVEVVATTCALDNGAIQILFHDEGGDYTFEWQPDVSQSASASGLAAGEYEITVGDTANCFHELVVTVPDSEGLTANWLQENDVTYPGGSDGSLVLATTGGALPLSFTWSTGDTANTQIDSLSAGSYSVTVTDSLGCNASLSAVISEPDPMVISAEITPEICQNGEGSIWVETDSDPEVEFLWLHNDETTAHLQNLVAGTYSVQATNAVGCIDSALFVVPATGEFWVEILPDFAEIIGGDSTQIITEISPDSLDVIYIWDPSEGLSCSDCPDPVASPDSTTSYSLTVISEQGCEARADLRIEVEHICPDFFIPDIFSPNGDGLNDEWCVFGGCISELQFEVYNRWGEKIFESNDQETCWDGMFNGAPLQSGALVYTVTAVLENGEMIKESGSLTIRR